MSGDREEGGPESPDFCGITERFLDAAARYPDNIAFHFWRGGWQTFSYRDFIAQVKALAGHLSDIGLGKGDRAAILSDNRPEWCSAYLGIVMAGGIAVPIDAQLGPAEIRNLLLDSGAKFVFHGAKTSGNLLEACGAFPAGAEPPLLIDFDSGSFPPQPGRTGNSLPLEAPDDIASIIYTSGTTGKPKGVVLTHRNFCADAAALIKADVVTHEDNVLAVLPLHHTYAFMCTFLVPVFLGASITFPASLKGPDLMKAMQDRGVSGLIAVPQLLFILRNGILDRIKELPRPLALLLFRLLRLSGFLRQTFGLNLGRSVFRSVQKSFGERFRFIGCGGARLDPSIMLDLEALGFTVLEGYGLTETAPVIAFNHPLRRKPGSVGRPLPTVEIRILDPSVTGDGEIIVRGPMVMKEYYRNPAATREAIRDGWFRTGDIGRFDEEGFLYITGRSKEVIVLSSGKNIFPEEVEAVYVASPFIKEICVTSVEREGISESLHAVIVPDIDYARQKQVSNIQEAVKWEINSLSDRLPSYMRVTGFSLRSDPLPRTPLGKIRRFIVREELSGAGGKKEEAPLKPSPEDETALGVESALIKYAKVERPVGLDDNLELDLGLDSLSKIELLASLEQAFSLKLPEDFLTGIHTVSELVEKVKTQAAGPSAGAGARVGWKAILAEGPSEKDLRGLSLESTEKGMLAVKVLHCLLKGIMRVSFRIEARGTENIPSGRNYIITPNHTSYLDGFAVILSLPFSNFRDLYSLGLREYFTGAIKGRLARSAHVIPIDSSSYLNKALQMSAYVLMNGKSLCVFPEGGRSFDGNLMEFKKGVGILALELGVPVVPAYIGGAFEALPKGAWLPRLRKITVTFGQPLSAENVDLSKKPEGLDDYQYFANVLRDRVKEASGGRPHA